MFQWYKTHRLYVLNAYIIYSDTVSQVFASRIDVFERFEHVEIPENKTVEFCIIVWGPLTEDVHVLVETTDSALALGKSTIVSLLMFGKFWQVIRST